MTGRKKRFMLRAVVSAALCACIAVSPALRGVHAESQSELEEKIKDRQAEIAELDRKISRINGDIQSSYELQEYYTQKLAATKDQIDLINNSLYEKEQQIAAKQTEIEEKQAEIDAKQLEIDEKDKDITSKELAIRLKSDQIDTVERKLDDDQNTIERKDEEIGILQRKNDDNIERFGQIVKAMYMTDTNDYMSVIAGSADFYDIFVRSEIMKSVGEQNMDFMNQLLSDIHKLSDDKLDLEDDKKRLHTDKERLETEKTELLGDREALLEERAALEDEKAELNAQKLSLDNEKAQLEAEKASIQADKANAAALSTSYTYQYNTLSAQIENFEEKQQEYAQRQKVSREEIAAYEAQIDEIIRQAQLNASNTVVYDNGDWIWPLDHGFTNITTYFGYSDFHQGNHGAIDIAGSGIMGANIYASKAGEVIVAKTTYIQGYDYGMYVVIDHGNGYQTLYAHMSAIYVTVGQMVNQGDVLGAVGSTGWSTGPHLHFEMRLNGVRTDPLGVVSVP